MKILLVSGGISSERKISLISAREVKKVLEENGYQVKIFDLRTCSQVRKTLRQQAVLKKGYPALKQDIQDFDVIFPVIHGEEGEGGNLHKFLENLGKPYVGGNWQNYKKGWYKIPFKKFCGQNNIPTSPWKTVNKADDIVKFGFPCVLKASAGGSSREVLILKSKEQLKKAEKLLKLNDKFLVEKFLPGTEVTVGILDNRALPVLEIRPPEGKWFDYKNKYSGSTKEIPNAPSLNQNERTAVQGQALKIHQLLGLGPYSRIDFIVSGGTPYVLEVNTIPGWTSESLFPKAAKAAGITFFQLVEKLIKMPHKPT